MSVEMFIFFITTTTSLRLVCVQNLFTFLVWNNVATMNALQQQHKQVLLTYWLLGDISLFHVLRQPNIDLDCCIYYQYI